MNGQLASPLPSVELHALAAALGSDVPFFLYAGAARCTGRGEIITAVPAPPNHPIILFKPGFPVSTPDAYRHSLDAEPIPSIPYASQSYGGLSLVNDLEKAVFAKYRYLAELKAWLLNRRDTKAALMSGSGSTMFAILHPNANPENLIETTHRYFDETLWTWSGTL